MRSRVEDPCVSLIPSWNHRQDDLSGEGCDPLRQPIGGAGRLGLVRDVFDHFTMMAQSPGPRHQCLVTERARPLSDTTEVHARNSGFQLDFFSLPDAAVGHRQAKCVVERGSVSLVDGGKQLRQISQRLRVSRTSSRARGSSAEGAPASTPWAASFLRCAEAMRDAITSAGTPASSPSRYLEILRSHSTRVARARLIVGSSRLLWAICRHNLAGRLFDLVGGKDLRQPSVDVGEEAVFAHSQAGGVPVWQ